LVSKKLPGIRLVSVELEVRGKPTAEGAETLQQLLAPRFARDPEPPGVGNMDFDFVAFPQLQCFDHSGRKADGKAVAPLGDSHVMLPSGYTKKHMYIQRCWGSRATLTGKVHLGTDGRADDAPR